MTVKAPNLDELFDTTIGLSSAEERGVFVRTVCENQPDLGQRLRRLLAAHYSNDQLFDAPIVPSFSVQLREQPGDCIGPYRLVERIGRGGMGTVYFAERDSSEPRQVALKIINPEMDVRQVVARFEVERQTLAMMDHPSIAKVLDAGETDDGRPYFVMELVRGVPFNRYCDQNRLTIRERLELFVPVCLAVQHAHRKGIIHRDIKPSNILVAERENRVTPVIIDFGIAKAVSPLCPDGTAFTHFGQIVGTLEYMSPEQAQFGPADVDTRSDVYSLGVLLYELLTGETPFDKRRLSDAPIDEFLRTIREDEPPRPSTRYRAGEEYSVAADDRQSQPRSLKKLLRGELDWIVMKALEKDPGRRYDTAGKLADDVRNYLANDPVTACPPSVLYRLKKFARRRKAAIAMSAALVLSLLVGTVGTAWQAWHVTVERDRAVEAESRAVRQADRAAHAEKESQAAASRAQHAYQVLMEILRAGNPYSPQGGPLDYSVRQLLWDFESKKLASLSGEPLLQAEIHLILGNIKTSFGLFGEAQHNLDRAREIICSNCGENHPRHAEVLLQIAYFHRRRADFPEQERAVRQALGIAEDHPGQVSLKFRAMTTLAECLISQEKPDEVDRVILQCREFASRAGLERNPTFGKLLQIEATRLLSIGALVDAKREAERALEIMKDWRSEWDTGQIYGLLGEIAERQKDFDRAEILFRESLNAFRNKMGTGYWRTGQRLWDIQRVTERRGVSVDVAELIAPFQGLALSRYYGDRCQAELRRNAVAEYQETCEEALEFMAESQNRRACLEVAMWCSLRQDAVADWSRVVESVYRESEDPGSPYYYGEQARLGGVLYRSGDYEGAIRAIAEARRQLNVESPMEQIVHAKSCFFEAMAHQKLGRASRAERSLEEGERFLSAMTAGSIMAQRREDLRDHHFMGELLKIEAEQMIRSTQL